MIKGNLARGGIVSWKNSGHVFRQMSERLISVFTTKPAPLAALKGMPPLSGGNLKGRG